MNSIIENDTGVDCEALELSEAVMLGNSGDGWISASAKVSYCWHPDLGGPRNGCIEVDSTGKPSGEKCSYKTSTTDPGSAAARDRIREYTANYAKQEEREFAEEWGLPIE